MHTKQAGMHYKAYKTGLDALKCIQKQAGMLYNAYTTSQDAL